MRQNLILNKKTLVQMKLHLPFYLLLMIPIAQVIILNYIPNYGIVIAFKSYKFSWNILGSQWIGLTKFKKVFTDPFFIRILANIIKISVISMIVSFPLPIVFSLLINEVMSLRFKKIVQTISYMSHFLSWVVMGGIVYRLFSPTNGAVNSLMVDLGLFKEPVYFMIQPGSFIMIYLMAIIWKETGWGTIIYLAAIAGVDTWLSRMISAALTASAGPAWSRVVGRICPAAESRITSMWRFMARPAIYPFISVSGRALAPETLYERHRPANGNNPAVLDEPEQQHNMRRSVKWAIVKKSF